MRGGLYVSSSLQAYAYCGCYYSTPSDLHNCASQELKLGTSGSPDRDSDNAAAVSGRLTPTTTAEANTPIIYGGIQTSKPASSTVSQARVITIQGSPSVVSVTSTVSDRPIISYFTSYYSLTFTVSESYIQTVHLHHGTPTAPDGLRTATPGEPGGASENPSSTSTAASNVLGTTTSEGPSGPSNSPGNASSPGSTSTPAFHRPSPAAITGSENRGLDGSTTATRPSLTRSPASFSNTTATRKSITSESPAPALAPGPGGPQQSSSEQRQGPLLTPNVPPIPALSSTASEQRQAGPRASKSNNILEPSPAPASAANMAPSPGGSPGPDGTHPNAEKGSPPISSQAQPQDVGQNVGTVTASPLKGANSMTTDSPYMIGATQDRNTGELQSEIPVQTQAPAPVPAPAAVAGGTPAAKGQTQQQQQQQNPPAEQSSPNAGPSNGQPSNRQPSNRAPSNNPAEQQQQAASNSQPPNTQPSSSMAQQQPPPTPPSDSSNNAPTAGAGGGPGSEGPPNAGSAAAPVSSGSYPSSTTVATAALGTAVIQPAMANGGVQLGVMCPASSCRKRSKIFR